MINEERKALVERLREWAQDVFLNLPGLYSEFRQLTDQIEADGQRIAELEAALRFYADIENHRYVKAAGCTQCEADAGEIARAALGEVK